MSLLCCPPLGTLAVHDVACMASCAPPPTPALSRPQVLDEMPARVPFAVRGRVALEAWAMPHVPSTSDVVTMAALYHCGEAAAPGRQPGDAHAPAPGQQRRAVAAPRPPPPPPVPLFVEGVRISAECALVCICCCHPIGEMEMIECRLLWKLTVLAFPAPVVRRMHAPGQQARQPRFKMWGKGCADGQRQIRSQRHGSIQAHITSDPYLMPFVNMC